MLMQNAFKVSRLKCCKPGIKGIPEMSNYHCCINGAL